MKRHYLKLMAAVLAAVLLLGMPCAFAADEETPAYYKDVEVSMGVITADLKVNLRSDASTNSRVMGHLEPGTEVTVLDAADKDWVKVRYGDIVGYVSASFITVSTYVDQVEVVEEDPLEVTLENMEAPDLMDWRHSFTLRGNVNTNIPMTALTVEVQDMRTLEMVVNVRREFTREEGMQSFNLAKLDPDLPFSRLVPGEKQLRIIVESASEKTTAFQRDFYIRGNYGELAHMTDKCKIAVTSGRKDYLTDNNYRTGWQPGKAEDTVTITVPKDRVAGALTIDWTRVPTAFTVSLAGEGGNVIQTLEENNEGGMLAFYYDLPAETREIVISTTDTENSICELRVMEQGKISSMTQKWQPVEGKVDLLIFSTHQDDEMLFFGGTIPYYVAQGKNVMVVYMANCGRDRYEEAMNGLWACGLKNHPVFLGFKDSRPDKYEQAVELWGLENTEAAVVELIRKYKPDVIVTHDINGEYGHNQHKVTSYAVRRAVLLAADPESYPTSYEEYGLWDTKKLYIHLYEGNQLTMTVYDEPLDALNGLTPTQVATIGYSKHVSQQKDYSMEKTGVKYDNRVYGLNRTTVGYDEAGNDLFENIDN